VRFYPAAGWSALKVWPVGNFPESCELFAANCSDAEKPAADTQWQPILARSKLGPHQQHFFQLEPTQEPVTHVKLVIHPGRLRLLYYVVQLTSKQTAVSRGFA
jgi:allantoicase